MSPVLEQVLHVVPDLQAWRPGHDSVVEGLVAVVLQLQHQVEAVHHLIRGVEALDIHVHVQAPICIQQKRPDGIPCKSIYKASVPFLAHAYTSCATSPQVS